MHEAYRMYSKHGCHNRPRGCFKSFLRQLMCIWPSRVPWSFDKYSRAAKTMMAIAIKNRNKTIPCRLPTWHGQLHVILAQNFTGTHRPTCLYIFMSKNYAYIFVTSNLATDRILCPEIEWHRLGRNVAGKQQKPSILSPLHSLTTRNGCRTHPTTNSKPTQEKGKQETIENNRKLGKSKAINTEAMKLNNKRNEIPEGKRDKNRYREQRRSCRMQRRYVQWYMCAKNPCTWTKPE